MWQWHCTIPVIAVIETLLYEVGVQEKWFKPDTKLRKIIDTVQSRGVITNALRDKLHSLREYRNEIHIYLKTKEVEMCDGKPTKYNDAVKALKDTEKALTTYFEKKI
jgi:hypothetical protein